MVYLKGKPGVDFAVCVCGCRVCLPPIFGRQPETHCAEATTGCMFIVPKEEDSQEAYILRRTITAPTR